MQQMTDSLKESIRSSFQVPAARVEIYNSDGSYYGILEDVENVSVSVASSRDILRTIKITLDNTDSKYTPDPELFEENFFWYTKTMKVFFGYKTGENMDYEEVMPQGVFTIEGIKATDNPNDNYIEIEGNDLKVKLIDDKFDDVFKVKGTASESPNYASAGNGSSVTVSSQDAKNPGIRINDGFLTTYWSPSKATTDPQTITIDMGQDRLINVIYLQWGEQSFDFNRRVFYYLEHSADNINWYRIMDLNGHDETASKFGEVEHVFDPITCRYFRIIVMEWTGTLMLMDVRAQNITATQTIDKVIKDVAFTAGITNYRIPITRRYIKEAMANVGDEKLKFMKKMATSIGWIEPQFDEEGYLITHPRDINPLKLAWHFHVDTDNIFSFSPKFSSYNVCNVIVVIYKSSTDKTIVGRAIDNNPKSPTYVNRPGMGRRVKTYESDAYNTQEKVNMYAQQKLYERTRFKHQTNLPITGHPGIQVDDVIQVEIPTSKIKELYVVTGFDSDFSVRGASYDTRVHISQLGTFNDEEAGEVE
jgi:hypothetical protein